jgi:YgiT-type zinc finger domain-containing protein
MTNKIRNCDVCHIGHYQSVKAPYLYWVDDQMMIMPNSPALACDICGQVQFEPAFLAHIERLLQELESSLEIRRGTKFPVQVGDPVSWLPSRGDG